MGFQLQNIQEYIHEIYETTIKIKKGEIKLEDEPKSQYERVSEGQNNMEIHRDEQQENFTLVLSRDELREIRDALGVRCLYLEALLRKKASIARSKDVSDDGEARKIQNDKTREMYIKIVKEME